MIPILIQKPPITHRQKKIAVSIAGAVDLLQIAVFPFLFPGWAVDDALDVIAALVLVAICGFKWQFIAVFVLELVPGLDLFPTWTALALTLPSAGPIPVESTSNSPVIGATRVPPVQHPTLPSTTTNP